MSGGWHTIESDAGVFTYLTEKLGVQDVQFEELISLDADDLAQLYPLHGVIFLFKFPTDAPYTADAPIDGAFDHTAAENLFFAQQVIQNACATQALLSVILNKTADSPSETKINIGTPLADFREFTMGLPPDIRGEALSNSELIRTVHNSFSKSSPFADETVKPADAETEDAFHFIAYTCLDGKLYELDGLQPAPISHGACSQGQFPSQVVDVLRRRIERYDASEIRFNLLAMVRDLRARAIEFGDEAALKAEQQKRKEWQFENALRSHNFLGFAGEVLKGVVDLKIKQGGEEGYNKWVDDALEKRKAEERAKRAAKGGGEDVDMKG
jgi:ubiquitin carboxyl-terminal hydrolase L5